MLTEDLQSAFYVLPITVFLKKKASVIRGTGRLHSKSIRESGDQGKKMVGPAGFEPATK